LANLLIWLVLTAEVEGITFFGKWTTPLTVVGTFLFRPIAHLVPWDLLVLGLFVWARPGMRKNLAAPLLGSMKLTCWALLGAWVWGVLRGGSAYQTYFQLHSFLMGLLLALMVMAVYRTTADIRSLGTTVVFAAMYRAVVLIIFYFLIARNLEEEMPTLTDHADSVLFVVGFFIVLVNWMNRRTGSSLAWATGVIVLMSIAIALNNRRIAWLGVGVGLLLIYVLLPPGRFKSKINRTLIYASPLIIAYVVAGWSSKNPVFKPVASISTMFGDNQDTSSMMRDIENYNLLVSLKTNPLLGMGWGWEYVEQIHAIDISEGFPQYRYLPHNSLLGIIAFSGMLWFSGFWQLVPVAAFFHARVWVSARSYVLRVAAMTSLTALTIVVVEMWGDVGFNHILVESVLGLAIGLAARLAGLAAVEAGAQSRGKT
jgi:hypothetical protein